MQFTSYLLLSVISYLGFFLGNVLIKIAPEEKIQLKATFKSIYFISLSLVFAFSIFYFINKKEILAILAYLVLCALAYFRMNDEIKKHMVIYAILGIIFSLSSVNVNLFIIVSSLIFIFGLCCGSFLKEAKKSLLYGSIFLVISNLMFFTTSHSLS